MATKVPHWLRALISKVIRVGSEEQINRKALRLIAGENVTLTPQDSATSDETRVTIAVPTASLESAVGEILDEEFIEGIVEAEVAEAIDDLPLSTIEDVAANAIVANPTGSAAAPAALEIGQDSIAFRSGAGNLESHTAADNQLLGFNKEGQLQFLPPNAFLFGWLDGSLFQQKAGPEQVYAAPMGPDEDIYALAPINYGVGLYFVRVITIVTDEDTNVYVVDRTFTARRTDGPSLLTVDEASIATIQGPPYADQSGFAVEVAYLDSDGITPALGGGPSGPGDLAIHVTNNQATKDTNTVNIVGYSFVAVPAAP